VSLASVSLARGPDWQREARKKDRVSTYEQEHPPGQSLTAEVSKTMVRLMSEYTGRGPTKARTTIDGDLVVTLLRDTLTKGERRLADLGEVDSVLDMRRAFQRSMCDEASAAVGALVGRKVIGFMSANHADPDLAVEVFVLEPAESDPIIPA
jgi:uncharacterized protein YbcI